jgi:hypothetical protein
MATASVHCPKCASKFSVPRETAGRRAKCPKCNERFVIQFSDQSHSQQLEIETPFRRLPPASLETPAESASAPENAAGLASTRGTTRGPTGPQWSIVALTALVSLPLGYLAGREHLKHQARNALADAARAGAENTAASAEKKPSADDETSVVKVIASTPQPQREPPPPLVIGQSHAANGFSISLVDARIENAQFTDILGNATVGDDPSLVLQFEILNTDDRRLLRFRERDLFGPEPFQLRDDVDNQIRRMPYGIGTQPAGALTSYDDIAPGATATHVELFSLPPPETEYLIATVDLACFGEEGVIGFQIPAEQIKRESSLQP